MVEIIKPKNREEWLEIRRTGIGSSDVPVILGLSSQYNTPHSLWLQKRGEVEKSEVGDMRLAQMGHNLEDAIAVTWSQETGYEVIGASRGDWQFRRTEKPWMLASPDRTYWLKGAKKNAKDWHAKGILECKSTQKDPEKDERLLRRWYAQVQWQLLVGDMEEAHIAWLIGSGFRFGYRRWERNEAFCSKMLSIVEDFWDGVVGGREPSPVNLSDVVSMFPCEVDGKEVEVDEETAKLIEDYRMTAELIKGYETEQEEKKAKIAVAIGDAEKAMRDGMLLATYKKSKDSVRVDASKLKENYPDVYDKVVKISTGTRRLLIK